MSCVMYHLQRSKKDFLYPRNRSSILEENTLSSYFGKFFKIKQFQNGFSPKEVALVTFASPEITFSRNSTFSAFSFWLYHPEGGCGIQGKFSFFDKFWRFLSNFNIWHYTDLRNFEWIPLRCFSGKATQFLGFLY